MLIKEKIGNLAAIEIKGREIDTLLLEWHECNKRMLHKRTEGGREVVLKFLKEAQWLQQDDVLYVDEKTIIAVEISVCDAIVIKPKTMYEMAYVCYEIGNKHLPLFYEEGTLLIPYDAPTLRVLQAMGMKVEVEQKKLLNQMRTTVAPHAHSGGETLFAKILKLTSANE
jgi:urease accessory protein